MNNICTIIIGSFLLISCNNQNTLPNKTENKSTIDQTHTIEEKQPYWRKIKRAGTPNGNRFFTDEKGNKLFNAKIFYNAHDFKNGYSVVSIMGKDNREKWGIIDESGSFLLEAINDYYIRDFENGFFEIANPKIGYLNVQGILVIPMEYTSSKGFYKNTVKLQKQYKKWGILNDKGEEIVPFIYDEMGQWKQELCAVKREGKWGFINLNGKETIPCKYDLAYGFERGISLVKKGKKIGLINSKDEIVADFVFTDFKEITDVRKDEISETGYINTNRRVIMKEGYIILKKEDKWGYLDTLGNEVIPFEYDYIGIPSSSGTIQIEKNKHSGTYNIHSKKETLK